MRLLPLVVLLALPALGQAVPESPRTPSPAVATFGSAAVGVGTGWLAASAAGAEAVPVVLAFQAGYAVGVGLALPVIAEWAGAEGSAKRAFRGAMLGGALGMATTGGLALIATAGADDRPFPGGIGVAVAVLAAGTGVAVAAPPWLAARGFDIGPVAVAGPTVTPAPGLSVRVGL